MRINPIQSYNQKFHPQANVSYKGVKGALKGAGIGGLTMGGITLIALASWPAALILGGVTAGLSAIIGDDFEYQEEKRKLEEQKRNETH